jgi:hypothetical protein
MKAVLAISALTLALAASWAAYAASADEAVAEMKNCAVCKLMTESPGLMENMTWECHKVDAGMLCLASVPKDMKKQYDEVHKKMMEKVEQVKAESAAGRDVELCHFCSAMGDLEQAGAKAETVDTATGSI